MANITELMSNRDGTQPRLCPPKHCWSFYGPALSSRFGDLYLAKAGEEELLELSV